MYIYVGVYRHHRTAATHLLAILISSDDRKHKPYALPVQMIPYVGMAHNKMRKLLNKLILTMTNMGMTVVGTLHTMYNNTTPSNRHVHVPTIPICMTGTVVMQPCNSIYMDMFVNL